MADQGDKGPKLHIDSDWKASAQAERARLTEKEQTRESRRGEAALPKATFSTLVDMLASQAVMSLGAMADPKTGRVIVDPQGAKFSIDLLQVIEEKTKNNLTSEEADHIKHLLVELRARFVQIMQLVAAQGGGMPADEAFDDDEEPQGADEGADDAAQAPEQPEQTRKSNIIIE